MVKDFAAAFAEALIEEARPVVTRADRATGSISAAFDRLEGEIRKARFASSIRRDAREIACRRRGFSYHGDTE